MNYLVFSILLSAVASPAIGGICSLELLTRLTRGKNWPDKNYIIVSKNKSGNVLIDGIAAKEFEVPNTHNRGGRHKTMYEFRHNNKVYLVKVMSEWTAHPDVFDQQINGMKLGEEFGGPKIYRVGKISCLDGEVRRFVEMEKLFPNDPNTFTLKAMGKKRVKDRLNKNPILYEKMSALIIKAMEHRVAPGADIDFIFSKNEAAFIDTDGFSYYGQYRIDEKFVASVESLCENFKVYSNPEGAKFFIKSFLGQLKRSQSLSDTDKSQILRYPLFIRDNFFKNALLEIVPPGTPIPVGASNREIVSTIMGFQIPPDDGPKRFDP